MIHELKTIEPFFSDLRAGRKPFEIRRDDRDFKVYDFLCLQKFTPCHCLEPHLRSPHIPCPHCPDPHGRYSGEIILAEIIYIYRPAELLNLIPAGHCLLSLKVYNHACWDDCLKHRFRHYLRPDLTYHPQPKQAPPVTCIDLQNAMSQLPSQNWTLRS